MKDRLFINKVYEKYNNIDVVYENDDFLKTNFIKENQKSIKIKYIMLMLFMIIVISGSIYATIRIIGKVKVIPTTNETNIINENDIWIGSFQIAWEELTNFIGGKVELEQKSKIVDSLNNSKFKKEDLSNNDYYLKVGFSTKKLRKEIIEEVKNKYNKIPEINLDNDISATNGITIYSIINKKFTFKNQFDLLPSSTFANSFTKYRYFGINSESSADLKDIIKVLFYNNENDFAIQINTNEEEIIILYRTNVNSSFDDAYDRLNKEKQNYVGNEKLNKYDEVKIPFLSLNGIVEYNELCGQKIIGTQELYITDAIQEVEFNLNEKGGNLKSESKIDMEYLTENIYGKKYYFDDNFILFMVEKNRKNPYMCLNVENTNILVEE